MSDPTSDGPWRLFCALDLPEEARAAIAAWQSVNGAAAEAGRWRPVPPEKLHVTLAFLGDRDPSRVEEIAALLRTLDAPRPITARPLPGPVSLPRRGPGLIALELESEEAAALHEDLAAGLRSAGLTGEEGRPFWPHITVFRRSRSAVRQASRGGADRAARGGWRGTRTCVRFRPGRSLPF